MEIAKTDMQGMAFDECVRPPNLTCHPYPSAFLKELHDAREIPIDEAFGSQETLDDYSKLRVDGVLAHQGKRGKNVGNEFAPKLLKEFPLAAGKKMLSRLLRSLPRNS